SHAAAGVALSVPTMSTPAASVAVLRSAFIGISFSGGARRARSVYNPPAAVGLAAGGTIAVLHMTPDRASLLVLTAVLAAVRLVGAGRRHRPGVAAVRVDPLCGRADRCRFQRDLMGACGIEIISAIERLADFRARKHPEQRTGGGSRKLAR